MTESTGKTQEADVDLEEMEGLACDIHGIVTGLDPDLGDGDIYMLTDAKSKAEQILEALRRTLWGLKGQPAWGKVEAGVTCVVCPGCAFAFDASHEDADKPAGRGHYSCPNCGAEGQLEWNLNDDARYDGDGVADSHE